MLQCFRLVGELGADGGERVVGGWIGALTGDLVAADRQVPEIGCNSNLHRGRPLPAGWGAPTRFFLLYVCRQMPPGKPTAETYRRERKTMQKREREMGRRTTGVVVGYAQQAGTGRNRPLAGAN